MNSGVHIICESDRHDGHYLDRPAVIERVISFFDIPVHLRVEIMNKYAGLSDIIPVARILCDAVMEITLQKASSDKCCVSCQKGCSACCSYLVPLSVGEVLRLQRELLQMPSSRRVPILKASVEAASKILKSRKLELNRKSENLNTISQWYADLDIQCPFLSNGTCSIYDKRPLACREYYVSSRPQFCQVGSTVEPDTISPSVSILESFGSLEMQLEESNTQAVILPLALIGTDEFSMRSRRTWSATKMINMFLDIIEETAAKNIQV